MTNIILASIICVDIWQEKYLQTRLEAAFAIQNIFHEKYRTQDHTLPEEHELWHSGILAKDTVFRHARLDENSWEFYLVPQNPLWGRVVFLNSLGNLQILKVSEYCAKVGIE